MLILTRRINEILRVGEDVLVTVLGIKGNQVRIGIDAPRDMPVHRQEIFEKIQREQASDGGVENPKGWAYDDSSYDEEKDFNK